MQSSQSVLSQGTAACSQLMQFSSSVIPESPTSHPAFLDMTQKKRLAFFACDTFLSRDVGNRFFLAKVESQDPLLGVISGCNTTILVLRLLFSLLLMSSMLELDSEKRYSGI